MRTIFLGLTVLILLVACSDDDVESNDNNNSNQSQLLCGNGVLEGIEECDDGAANSDTLANACRTDCSLPHCGDGVEDEQEACDQGAGNSDALPDVCRTSCVEPRCGDGVVDVVHGEQCDEGDTPPTGTCSPNCVVVFCGNGVLEDGERCDDGNFVAGDGCSPDCQSDETCGNGRIDISMGEQCDCGTDAVELPTGCDAPNGEPESPCTQGCQTRICGNGVLNEGELCDDGNTANGDGCSADCLSDETCGNLIVDTLAGEYCDEGAANALTPNAPCRPGCVLRRCGDGIVDDLFGESCDDATANSDNTADACRSNCLLARCGDGFLDTAEICDDGNSANGDGCSADCRSDETCGNLIVDAAAGEGCDNGTYNSEAPDAACRTDCRIRRCGDSVMDTGEVCDDGNNNSGDGCSANCQSGEVCGNGVIDVNEACEPGDLAGATCATEGYTGGTLRCTGCQLDSYLCYTCGNGLCEAEELLTTCPADCGGGVVAIDAGAYHTCAVIADGSVYCWGGDNYVGVVDPPLNSWGDASPVPVTNLTDASSVHTGFLHSCAIRADQSAVCWGQNDHGQLGNQSPSGWQDTPVQVLGLSNILDLSIGLVSTCALLNGGTVSCWGDNSVLQLGTVVQGTNESVVPVQVDGVSTAVQIASGSRHTCALLSDSSVVCWGNRACYQTGDGQTATAPTLAVPVVGLTGVTSIGANEDSTCAVIANGTGWCWGRVPVVSQNMMTCQDFPSQVPNLPAPVVRIHTGAMHACSLLQDGSVWCWGSGAFGELGDGLFHSPSEYLFNPVQVLNISDASGLALGRYFSCVTRDSGALACWGLNAYGQLGDGTADDRHTPVQPLL